MRAVAEVIPAAPLHAKRKAILSPHQLADACAEEACGAFPAMLVTT